jgi:site-specific DNA-methyltransferase (cytosine-N4-specific)
MLKFEPLKSVNNPKSVHGIYPYRGKISSLDAEKVIGQLKKNKTLLDPFCGSGTILYEANKAGLNSIGIDMNPLAILLAKGKIEIQEDLKESLEITNALITKAKKTKKIIKNPKKNIKYFHEDSLDQILRLLNFYDEMPAYIKACFLGAICLNARGCNDYKWTSSSVGKNIEPKRYINFYDNFINKVKKHHYPLKNKTSNISYADSRKLSEIIKKNSVDYVFTSPPYFDCLDYTSYYTKIIYELLDIDRIEIKENLIQNFNSYEEDMIAVLDQLNYVCKKNALIIFVVGDKKVHGKIINGGEFFKKISPFKLIEVVERTYTNSTSKIFDSINKTSRKEQIIVWQK